MTRKKPTEAPKTCERCRHWKEIKRRMRVGDLLAEAVGAIEAKLKGKELKPTMGDYLKLLQLEQEFEKGEPKEVKVTWVEPEAASSVK